MQGEVPFLCNRAVNILKAVSCLLLLFYHAGFPFLTIINMGMILEVVQGTVEKGKSLRRRMAYLALRNIVEEIRVIQLKQLCTAAQRKVPIE